MFKIKGKYLRYASEVIDEFDTLAEAEKMLSEYRMAYGAGWSLWIVR
jgi:hypothetical protein